MRRALLSTAFAVSLATAALAGNVPYQSGPWDPTNALGFLNSFVQSLNANTNGLLASLPTAVTTSGTGANTVLAFTIPAVGAVGGGMGVGNVLRVHAEGTNAAETNVRTETLNFGATAVSCVVTGSAAEWAIDFFVVQTAAATQTAECRGVEGTTVLATTKATGTVSDAAAIAVTLTATTATSGNTVVNLAFADIIR